MSSRRAEAPARDQAGNGIALLIIDMIQAFDFDEAETLRRKAASISGTIAELRRRSMLAGIPVIFVNDNFGHWHSERARLIETAAAGAPEIVDRLRPAPRDYFIIKPQFSGFYATNLQVLLPKLGVRHLILTGVASDMCVLFTAADAHMRDYRLWVPQDAVASIDTQRGRWALEIMKEAMGASIAPTSEVGSMWPEQRDLDESHCS